MSRKTNNPAWSGLEPPERTRFTNASPKDTQMLKAAFGPDISVEAVKLDAKNANCFKICSKDNSISFVRRHNDPPGNLIELAELSRWIHDAGVPALQIDFVDYKIDGQPSVVYTSSPYLDCRYVGDSNNDIASLGKSVGQLHTALMTHPLKDDWTQKTRRRMDALTQIREKLIAGDMAVGPDPVAVREFASRMELEFDIDSEDCQPIHGDLNVGNVLVGPGGSVAYLIDFEDVHHSVLPPVFDLALTIERFIFARNFESDRALELARLFITSYQKYCKNSENDEVTGEVLYNTIRSLNLRSLCVLAGLQSVGVSSANSEWNKFLSLSDMADKQRDMWLAIC